MAVPRWIRIDGMLSAVDEDLSIGMNVGFEQEEDVCGCLDDTPRVRRNTWNAGRQTIGLGIVFRQSRVHQLFGFGQQRNRFTWRKPLRDVADWATALPDTRQIRSAVRQPGRRTVERLR